MPRYQRAPVIRAFTIPVPRFDYLKVCQSQHQQEADAGDYGRLITNSDALEMLLHEHQHLRVLHARTLKLVSQHLQAHEHDTSQPFPVDALKEHLEDFGRDIERAHLAVIRAEGGARKAPE